MVNQTEHIRRTLQLLRVGRKEQAKDEAEMIAKEKPEEASSFLSLAYVHLYGFLDLDKANEYLDETLRLDHESDFILSSVIDVYFQLQNRNRIKELTEIGLRNHPDKAHYHYYMARILLYEGRGEQSFPYFEKAIELSPTDDEVIGEYAYVLSFFFRNRKRALELEKLALELNPENITNLFYFADSAKEKGNFKKARMFAEVAMRLEPENEKVRDLYKSVIVTKNKFCAFTAGVSFILIKTIVTFIVRAVDKISFEKKKIFYPLLFIVSLSLFLCSIYYTGWYAGSFYLGLLIMYTISGKIKKKIYKQIGFTDKWEEELTKRKNQQVRKQELTKMKEKVDKEAEYTITSPKLSKDNFEAQLADFWQTGVKFELQSKASPAELNTVVQAKTEADPESASESASESAAAVRPKLTPEEHKQVQTYSEIKPPRYSLFFLCILISISAVLVYRYSELQHSSSTSIDQGLKTAIHESNQKEQAKQQEKTNLLLAKFSFHKLKTRMMNQESIEEVVEENYAHIVMKKAGTQEMNKLLTSSITKGYKEDSYSYLLVTSKDGSSYILKVKGQVIHHIYGEAWSDGKEDKEVFHDLLKTMETSGLDLD